MTVFVKAITLIRQLKGVKSVIFAKNGLLANEEGATAVEYGLIVASVSIVIIIGLSQISASTTSLMQLAIDAFETAAPTT